MPDFFRKILFKLEPELAHSVALKALRYAHLFKLTSFFPKIKTTPSTVMGLTFPNPIGIAAGLDKNGDFIDALSGLGFGFIEIGTITPGPQAGNPKPRLFRLEQHHAIINRMGFNNKGSAYVVKRLQKMKYKGILGINIGKNSRTPIEKAVEDYVMGFNCFAPYASYITINISSPNTAGLRDLQQAELLLNLLQAVKQEQEKFFKTHKKYVPLVVKLSPDLDDKALQAVAETLVLTKVDGVIATNSTASRAGIEDADCAQETGGLSGKPLSSRSTEKIKRLSQFLQNAMPIIASGGVMGSGDVKEKMTAGADLVQIYTGLIYAGPNDFLDSISK